MTILQHIKKGRLSGYNWVDIVWFFLRIRYRKMMGIQNRPIEVKKAPQYNHIVSPFTKIYHKITNKSITYTYCKECNWTQFDKLECNLCHKIPEQPNLRPKYRLCNGELILIGYK